MPNYAALSINTSHISPSRILWLAQSYRMVELEGRACYSMNSEVPTVLPSTQTGSYFRWSSRVKYSLPSHRLAVTRVHGTGVRSNQYTRPRNGRQRKGVNWWLAVVASSSRIFPGSVVLGIGPGYLSVEEGWLSYGARSAASRTTIPCIRIHRFVKSMSVLSLRSQSSPLHSWGWLICLGACMLHHIDL